MIRSEFLGSAEIRLLSTLEKEKQVVFTFEQAFSILKGNRQVCRNVLSRLAKKGRVKKVKRGVYFLVPFRLNEVQFNELAIIPKVVKNYYVSFWSGLKHYNFTEQLPTQVYVATLKPVKEIKLNNFSIKFVKLSKKYFTNWNTVNVNGIEINVATKEKLILDCLLHLEYSGGIGEVTKALRDYNKEINWREMQLQLNKMNNSAVERRLKYLLNYLKIKTPLTFKNKFNGTRLLDATIKSKGKYDVKYGLNINVNLESELQ